MGFSFLNKKRVIQDVFTHRDKVSQAIDFILNKNNYVNEDFIFYVLKNFNEKELEELFYILDHSNKSKYNSLLQASKALSLQNLVSNHEYYGFETGIKKKYLFNFNNALLSLNTGDLLAFLINQYLYYKNFSHKIIIPATNPILLEIVIEIKRNSLLLDQEIDHQNYLPISKALFVFFIYDKKEAFNKFKTIIQKDLIRKNNSNFQHEYLVTLYRFFLKLGIDYIPKIDVISKDYGITLSEEINSISKKEILDVIDIGDYFNKKIPLLEFPANKLINNRNIENITEIISTIIKDHYFNTHTHKLEYDLGKVFIENITQPYPKYSRSILITTREILIKMFLEDNKFKMRFFYFLYNKKKHPDFLGWSTRFPVILNSYLNKAEGFGVTNIKKYFFDNSDNLVFEDDQEINLYLNSVDTTS